jgi:hypothetical protein
MRRRRMGTMNLNTLLPAPAGTSLYYPLLNPNATTVTDYSGNTIASDNAKQADNTTKQGGDTSYAPTGLTLTVANNLNGARFKFDLKQGAAGTTKGKLYKNGVAWGTEQSCSEAAFTTYTEDLTSLVAGDVITVWAYNLNEEWNARNLSISYDMAPNNATVIGAQLVRLPSGLYAYSHDGVDDSLTNATPTFIANTSGTIECWCKGTTVNAFTPFSIGDKDSTLTNLMLIALRSDTVCSILFYFGGGKNFEGTFTGYVAGIWQHYRVTSNGSTVKLYINNTEKTVTDATGSNTGQWFGSMANLDNFTIGGEWRSGVLVNDFNGITVLAKVNNGVVSGSFTKERKWFGV